MLSLMLSRQYVSGEASTNPDTILPSSCIVVAVTWKIQSLVKRAQQTQPDLGNGPPNHLFVPDSTHSQVLQLGHASRFPYYTGIGRTLSLLKRHFWWATMDADTRAFVSACTVCSKVLPSASYWFASPLAHPWSSLDPHGTRLRHRITPVPR